jgi:hypothetical protein
LLSGFLTYHPGLVKLAGRQDLSRLTWWLAVARP